MMLRLRYALPVLLTVFSLVSCGPSDDAAKNSETAPAAPAGREKFEAFARQIATSIDNRDPSVLDSAMDMEALYYAMKSGADTSREELQEFLATNSPGFGFGEQIIKGLGNVGSLRLLRFDWNNGDPRAFYRIITSQGTLNYYDMHLAQREDSKLVIRDIYVYLNDETFATTMRRALGADPEDTLSRMYAPQRVEGTGKLNEVDSMALLYRDKQYEEMMSYHESLPETSRNNRMVQYYRMFAAQQLGEARYKQVLEEVNRKFAGSPSMDLMMVNHHILNRQFDSTLVVVDRIDRLVGGDPYLNLIRSHVASEKNEIAQAKDYIQKVLAYDSTLTGPYFALMLLSLREKNYAETAKLLNLAEQRTGIDIDSALITQDEKMADFARSEEFRKWAAEQR